MEAFVAACSSIRDGLPSGVGTPLLEDLIAAATSTDQRALYWKKSFLKICQKHSGSEIPKKMRDEYDHWSKAPTYNSTDGIREAIKSFILALRSDNNLLKVSFSNLKRFKDQITLSLNANGSVSIFAGINASGKTTALQAIYLFIISLNTCRRKQFDGKLEGDVDGSFILPYLNAKGLDSLLSRTNPGTGQAKTIQIKGEIGRQTYDFTIRPNGTLNIVWTKETQELLRKRKDHFRVSYFSQLMQPIPKETENVADPVNITLAIEEGMVHYRIRNIVLQILKSEGASQFQRLMADLLGIQLKVELEGEGSQPIIHASFAVIDGDSNVLLPLNLLSGGQHHVLMILAACFYMRRIAFPNAHHIFLLDEPTKNLHNALALQFLDAIKMMDNCQIVMATHSLEMLSADPLSITSFTPTPPRNLADSAALMDVLKNHGVIDALSPHADGLTRALTHMRILIVEGKIDQLILKAWMDKLTPRLGIKARRQFEERVTIVQTRGQKKWDYLEPIIDALQGQRTSTSNLKIRVLFDRDNETHNNVQRKTTNIKQKCRFDLKVIVWKRRHIESYCLDSSALLEYQRKNNISGPTLEEILKELREETHAYYWKAVVERGRRSPTEFKKDFQETEQLLSTGNLQHLVDGKEVLARIASRAELDTAKLVEMQQDIIQLISAPPQEIVDVVTELHSWALS